MKYIVCQIQRDGEPLMNVPFIFPDILVHSMVFEQTRALLASTFFSNKGKTEIIALSAGEFTSTVFNSGPDGLCHGKSTSLEVASRKEQDDLLLKMSDYGSGAMV